MITDEYYVVFIFHPKTAEYIFLRNDANIENIAYSKPIIPGTMNITEAKTYTSIDQAKKDICNLRYYHREFLKLKFGIKSITNIEIDHEIEYSKLYNLLQLART